MISVMHMISALTCAKYHECDGSEKRDKEKTRCDWRISANKLQKLGDVVQDL